jgi:WD40 repeat protein/serine/threonine protein kinase
MAEHPHEDVRHLFDMVLDLPASQRESVLDRECGSDESLKQRILAMISAAEDDRFLSGATADIDGHDPRSAGHAASTIAVSTAQVYVGQQIDRYTLLEQIGEGGFGSVWAAEQKEPVRRRVALKIIKLGMDTKQVVARFEAERQALAMMDHPNIAKVLDAGATDTGRPFFVMELVKGVPILEYCDKQKLDTKSRLDLFTKVCNAIQHAHQKGIIHRDIKPSNVMITLHDGVPVPKVIDFGIAKATNAELTEKTIYTRHRQMIGTPAYMSPEQAEMSGLDIDTRSDIYSLGVLLYEMLTGTTPFTDEELANAGLEGMMRMIREIEPQRPSIRFTSLGQTAAHTAAQRSVDIQRLGLLLRGDLDWIVMKCLEKDRTRRYETASSLAADIGRHLGDEPVVAGPPSAVYKFRKFVKRHRRGVAAAAIVSAAVVLGGLGTAAGLVWALDERARAETSEQQALLDRDAASTARDSAQASSYALGVQLAAQYLTDSQPILAQQALRESAEAMRGWEWRWLNSMADSSIGQLVGHADGVVDSCFDPAGTVIATASWDKTARLWDARTDALLLTLSSHEADLTSIGFDRTVRRVATASINGQVIVWHVSDGTVALRIKTGDSAVNDLAFSPDDRFIATVMSNGDLALWNAETGSLVYRLESAHGRGALSVDFSQDGELIVTAGRDNMARVWEAANGEQYVSMRHDNRVNRAVFSYDNTMIATASSRGHVQIWDVEAGKRIARLTEAPERFQSVAFDPRAKLVAAATADNTVVVWDLDSKIELSRMLGHTDQVMSVSFSPTGSRILTASLDGTARVWSTGNIERQVIQFGNELTSARFLPGSDRLIAAGWKGGAAVVDVPSGESVQLDGHGGRVNEIAISPDGQTIATAAEDESVRMWDASTRDLIAVLEGHEGGALAVAFDPTGDLLATGSLDAVVRVWDRKTHELVRSMRGHQGSIDAVAFSPNGSRLVSASGDGTARVWNRDTGEVELILEGHAGGVRSAVFSPDGTTIATASGAFRSTRFNFSADRTRARGLDDGDATARLWNAESGDMLHVLSGHQGGVVSAAFSPDGSRLATASHDGTARIWRVSDGQFLVSIGGHTDNVESVQFSPDGSRVLTASKDGTARIWSSGGER